MGSEIMSTLFWFFRELSLGSPLLTQKGLDISIRVFAIERRPCFLKKLSGKGKNRVSVNSKTGKKIWNHL